MLLEPGAESRSDTNVLGQNMTSISLQGMSSSRRPSYRCCCCYPMQLWYRDVALPSGPAAEFPAGSACSIASYRGRATAYCGQRTWRTALEVLVEAGRAWGPCLDGSTSMLMSLTLILALFEELVSVVPSLSIHSAPPRRCRCPPPARAGRLTTAKLHLPRLLPQWVQPMTAASIALSPVKHVPSRWTSAAGLLAAAVVLCACRTSTGETSLHTAAACYVLFKSVGCYLQHTCSFAADIQACGSSRQPKAYMLCNPHALSHCRCVCKPGGGGDSNAGGVPGRGGRRHRRSHPTGSARDACGSHQTPQ